MATAPAHSSAQFRAPDWPVRCFMIYNAVTAPNALTTYDRAISPPSQCASKTIGAPDDDIATHTGTGTDGDDWCWWWCCACAIDASDRRTDERTSERDRSPLQRNEKRS